MRVGSGDGGHVERAQTLEGKEGKAKYTEDYMGEN